MTEQDTRIPIPGTNVSETVITAVAAANGVDPTEVEPLYETIDPDALDELFEPRVDGVPREGGRLRFVVAGCEVVVRGDRVVEATPLDDAESCECE